MVVWLAGLSKNLKLWREDEHEVGWSLTKEKEKDCMEVSDEKMKRVFRL